MTSADSAGMVAKSKRDQSELFLFEKDGQIWAWVSDLLYSPADTVGTLNAGQSSVQIGSSGYNEWLKTGTGLILSFEIPIKGRVFVSTEVSTKLWDSALDRGDVFVPPGSFVQFAGQAGDIFKITAKDITDSEKQALIDRTIRYQTEGDIYHADSYTVVKLKKGDIIYGMLPGQSVFYTDQATLDSAKGSYKTMYELLQIRPHPVLWIPH